MGRESCEYKDRCGKTGHYQVKGVWHRCQCLEREINKQKLGFFDTPNPRKDSPLLKLRTENVLLEGPLASVRPHMAGVILALSAEGKSVKAIDAYRLVEIFIDKDEEFRSYQDIADYELLVIMLGFGDVKNQRLPDLIMQVLNRRELIQKPTWVILGLPLLQVGTRYSLEIQESLSRFRRAKA